MPTIEFHGYDAQQQTSLSAELRAEYDDLDFCEEIVFVLDTQPTRRVETWSGGQAPFVRISSRSSARLEQLVGKTQPHSDVETVIIGFHAQTTDG